MVSNIFNLWIAHLCHYLQNVKNHSFVSEEDKSIVFISTLSTPLKSINTNMFACQ